MSLVSLVSAGSNARGQLATGNSEDAHQFSACQSAGFQPGTLPLGTHNIVQIACGANHTLLLLDRLEDPSSSLVERELWGCGDGSKGQLGPSYTADISAASGSTAVFRPLRLDLRRCGLQGYAIRTIAACWETSYIALSCPGRSDVLLSMGADDFGDLGVGGVKGKQSPSAVHIVDLQSVSCTRWDNSLTLRIISLTAGPHNMIVHLSLFQKDQDSQEVIVGWGTSRHGQLGRHTDASSGRPVPFLCSPHLVCLPCTSPVVAAASGTHHAVFLHDSGLLSGLGSDRKSQLNGVDNIENVTAVDCTWNGTYAVVRNLAEWDIVSTGNHSKGQLGRPLHTDNAATHSHPPSAVHFPFSHMTHRLVKIACGSEHILCLFSLAGKNNGDMYDTTEVWAWGWNEHGNLGIGNTQDQDVPVRIWPTSSAEGKAVDVWAGCGTSWIVLGE
ncbi:hypothetical protein PHLCEN_2v8249 [Hermanssonia centrifuga]|uniref:Uncharacterized protein n=1 Tax=Hermanssonia centrifuga TaxID=98765 RepID=A0A2R6NTY9_9APHY|nr:hypothetical protein PHLCEN_2v8249 [Hermanssonia centrifuga]